jgi:hypothetical protein
MKKTSKKLTSMRLEKNKTGSYARHWILPVPLQINDVGDRCQTFNNVAYCIEYDSYNRLALPMNVDRIETKNSRENTRFQIDKMFTRSIDEGKSAVLDGYIKMTKQLELNLVAEGVENKLEAKGLLFRGVFQHQGYYYAKPMPIEDLHRWALAHGYTHERVSETLN